MATLQRRLAQQRIGYAALPVLGLSLAAALRAAGFEATGAAVLACAGVLAAWLLWIQWPRWLSASWWRGKERDREALSPQSFLRYRGYRYLKLALLASGAAVAAYALQDPARRPSGGTPLGYALGTLAAGLMLWLMWFGVRKRRYGSSGAPLRAWLSGHVYLGLSLLVLIPLHSGFQLGWNVHTLAGALTGLVILSGLLGLLAYTQVPAPMTRNRPGQKLDALLQRVAEIDAELAVEAAGLPDAVALAIAAAIRESQGGGGLVLRLAARPRHAAVAEALRMVESAQAPVRLAELLSSKRMLLTRVHRDLRYKALLDLWLVVHVPLSFGAITAVAVHVFAVFYYR